MGRECNNCGKRATFKTATGANRSGRQRKLRSTATLFAAAIAGVAGVARAQNVADNVNTGATAALDTATNYSSNQLPGTTSDMVFTSSSYGTTSFTLNSTALTPGTLDDLNATQAFTITGTQSITIEGGSNSVAPSAGDLFYVASGGKLSTNTPIVLTTTAASGNFDLVGAGTLSGAISGSGFGFTKTGAGTLTLSSAASTFSGGVTLNGGVLNIAASSTGAAGSVTQGPLGIGALTLNGGTLSTVGGNGTLNNAININSGNNVFGSVSGSGNLYLGGAITGTGTFSNNATGTAASTYLQGNLSGFQGTFNLTTYSTTNLRFGSGSSQTINASQATFIINNGSGSTRNIAINDTYTNDVMEMGALSGNGVIEGSYTGSGNTYSIGYLNTNTIFSGRLSDTTSSGQAAFSVTKVGSGSLTLSATNSEYTGATTVENGDLLAGASSASGSAGAFGSASSAIALGDATSITGNYNPSLLITGSGVNLGRAITVGASTTATSGVYTIGGASANIGTLSGNIALNQSLSVSEASSGTLTISGIISTNNSTTPVVTFGGPGAVSLTAVNTYTGATAITGGTLTLAGSGGINSSSSIAINGSGARLVQTSSSAVTPGITVTNGTLDGTTTVGAVTVGSGTGGIVTNGNGGTGSLSVGSLTFLGAGTLSLNLPGGGTTAPGIVDLGVLQTNGAATVKVNATEASAWVNGTTYDLLSYGSTYTGSAGTNAGAGTTDFSLGTIGGLSSRQSATLGNNGVDITLTIAGDSPKWTGQTNITGATDANWTTTTGNLNWKLITAATATDFLTNDAVLFDDTATGPTAVNISGANVSPVSTTFNNSSLSYTISSSGGYGIATGSLVKGGTAALTINSSNNYSGGTTLNNGTLNIGNASALGTGTVTIAGGAIDNTSGAPITLAANNVENWNGNFTFNGSNALNTGTAAVTLGAPVVLTNNGSLTVGGAIGGTGPLTVAGSGILALNGVDAYSGGTTLNTGTLEINTSTAIGSGTFTIAGGTIDNTSGGAITLTDNNVQNWNANVTFAGSNALGLGNGTVTLGAPITVTANASTLTIGGAINGGYGLTKAGSGALVLGGSGGTFSGGTTLNAGTLTLGANSTPTSGTVTSGPIGTGTLTLAGGVLNANASVTIGNPITVTPSTTTDLQTSSVSTSQNLVLNGNISGSGTLEVIAIPGIVNQVQLGGNNDGSFTGTLIEDTGNTALQFNTTTAGSAAAAFVINNSASQRLKFNFGAGTINFGALSGSGFLANVATGTTTLSVGSLNTNTTFSGVLQANTTSDVLALTKVGSGTLTLSGRNTYIGGTIVNDGTLALANGGSIGAIIDTLTINSGGTVSTTVGDALGFTGGTSLTNVNVAGGLLDNATSSNEGFITSFSLTGGTMSSSGGGAFNLNVNAVTAAVAGITSNASGTTSLISAPLIIRSGGSLNIATGLGTTTSGVDLQISGIISDSQGSGGITATGSGVLALTGIDTYTGATLVNGGTVDIIGALANSASITVNASAASANLVLAGANAVPSVAAITGTAGSFVPTVTVSANQNFTSLTNAGTSNFNAGSTTIGTVTDTGTMNVAAPATLNATSAFTEGLVNNFGTININGGATNTITTLANVGTTDFSAGVGTVSTISGAGTVLVGSTASLNVTGGLSQGAVVSAGTINLSAGASNIIGQGSGVGTGAGGGSTTGGISGTGTLSVTSGAQLYAASIAQSLLSIDSASTVTIADSAAPGNTVATSVVTDINNAGTLDLKNNDLIVLDTTQYTTVRALINNAADGGAWDQAGINSSSARANNSAYGLGYAQASTLGSTSFDGQTFTDAVLVKYTLLGDTQLRGQVGIGDYDTVLNNFGSVQDWSGGDFHYGGTVGIGDYDDVLNNFGGTATGNLAAGSALTRGLSPALSLNPSFAKADLKLEVNTVTGDVYVLANTSVGFAGYTVADPSAHLVVGGSPDAAKLLSVAPQSGGNTNVYETAGTYVNWNKITEVANQVAEGQNNNGYANHSSRDDTVNIPSGGTIDFGDIYNTAAGIQDITFNFAEAGSNPTDGPAYYGAEVDYISATTPEPASVSLLAIGALGMLARRRRRQSEIKA